MVRAVGARSRRRLGRIGAPAAAAFALTALAQIATAADARACGACFHEATQQTTTVVTDHRMVLAVSAHQTTLYDQIEYSGSPSSFAWVLPVAGTVTVGVSSDRLFSTIDVDTQTVINAPPSSCPPRPPNCSFTTATSSTAYPPAASDPGTGVDVVSRAVVGPYDTVQLSADDPNALETWLSDNGFAITDAEKPVVAAYVAEHFDFLAVKLLPNAGTAAMRPIRVTSTGTSTTLPLRMIAAGAGAKVGITLWIVGEASYLPTNFDTFTIKADDLTWDWRRQSSDYTSIRAAKTTAGGGKIWEVESAGDVSTSNLESLVKSGSAANDYPAPPVPDAGADDGGTDAGASKTPDEARDEDLAVLLEGVPNGTARVTRIRADLSHDALATDLVLGAAADQAPVPRVRNVSKAVNAPTCPDYSFCASQGNGAADGGSGSDDDGGCATGPRSGSISVPEWVVAATLAFGLAVSKLARRKGPRK